MFMHIWLKSRYFFQHYEAGEFCAGKNLFNICREKAYENKLIGRFDQMVWWNESLAKII